MSNCCWGGILLKHPPQASLSTDTKANPFLTLFLILVYENNNLESPSYNRYERSSFFRLDETTVHYYFTPEPEQITVYGYGINYRYRLYRR